MTATGPFACLSGGGRSLCAGGKQTKLCSLRPARLSVFIVLVVMVGGGRITEKEAVVVSGGINWSVEQSARQVQRSCCLNVIHRKGIEAIL